MLGTLKRRLVKIEASMPSPDQKVYQFIAESGDQCLDVEPPWGGINILRVMVGPRGDSDDKSRHRPNIQQFAKALKAWEEHGTAPLTVEEWRRTVQNVETSDGHDSDPLLLADLAFADGLTRGRLPREAADEAARWENRLVEARN